MERPGAPPVDLLTIDQEDQVTQKDHKTDKALNQQLKESFPAIDPPAVTRAPADKRTGSEDAARIDRKPPKVSPSAEGQPDHDRKERK